MLPIGAQLTFYEVCCWGENFCQLPEEILSQFLSQLSEKTADNKIFLPAVCCAYYARLELAPAPARSREC